MKKIHHLLGTLALIVAVCVMTPTAHASQNNFPGPGYYTSITLQQSGGYIGWACNDGSISCSPGWTLTIWGIPWPASPGLGFKGHVLQTKNNPGKTFLIKPAPGGGGLYNIINVTDNSCLAVGDALYECNSWPYDNPGTRTGSNCNAGYLTAFQDTSTLPAAPCNYADDHVKWKIYDNGAGVDIKTDGGVNNYGGWPTYWDYCVGTDLFGLSRSIDGGNNWGDVWVRNLGPSCNSDGSRIILGSHAPTIDGFDAVEVGAAKATPLYTKLAGTAFSFDVLALKGGNVSTGYVGRLKIELVDAAAIGSPADCAKAPALMVINPSYYFASGTGRGTISSVTYQDASGKALAAPNVKIRMSDTVAGIISCSTDGFAIRPTQLALQLSPTGTTNKLVAGSSNFTITATSPVSGYTGTPVVDTSKVIDWQPKAIDSAMLTGGFNPANGTVATGTFQYGDFGSITFQGAPTTSPGAVSDATFTAVDQGGTPADCIQGSASNTLNGGRYGCVIDGTPALGTLGRFIPDHYEANIGFTPAHGTGSTAFTYMGQSFGLTLDIQAKNSNGGTMGRLLSSASNLPTFSVVADNAGTAITLDASNSFTLPSFAWPASGSGGIYSASGSRSFVRPAKPIGAYDNFRLILTVSDPDGVKITKLNGTSITGVSSVQATTAFRYGRLSLPPASGSELLDLQMKMQAQYWENAQRGWQINSLDTHTPGVTITLGPGTQAVLDNTCVLDSGNPGSSNVGCVTAGIAARRYVSPPTGPATNPTAGDFNLWLKAPGKDNFGYAMVTAENVPTWLGGNTSARATFGIVKPGPIIFRREMY